MTLGAGKQEQFGNEASVGLSFANVLLGIGLALTGLVVSNPPPAGLLKIATYSSVISFSAFFGTLFFANVHGALRLEDFRAYSRAMLWGNAFTEYLGVFLIVFTFPAFILAYSQDALLTRITLGVACSGFLVYQLSGFDLLGRWISSSLIHRSLSVCLVAAVILDVEIFLRFGELPSMIVTAVVLFAMACLTILDITSLSKIMNRKAAPATKPSA